MNKVRRNHLDEAISKIQEQLEMIMYVKDEEEEAYENMPESLQGSERGEQMSECIDTLDEAINTLDDVIASLQEIVDG